MSEDLETITIGKAAQRLGLAHCTVWRLYRAKRLRGFTKTGRTGSHVLLYLSSVEDLARQRKP